MNSKLIVSIVVLLILILCFMPNILQALGLHPKYKGKKYDLEGKRALIITTSHGILNAPGETTGKPTGVYASEMTVPYYEFTDAKMAVDIASIQGGEIPIEKQSLNWFIRTKADKRFLKDSLFQNKVKHSMKIDHIDFTQYDVIFFAGGWGAAYDLGYSTILGEKISDAYKDSPAIFGSVCHGALGFIQAKDSVGNALIEGRIMTGVTNKQIKELKVTFTPMHPEEELIMAGADYKSNTAFMDLFANLTVIDSEKRFVTGQNQNAGHEVAQKIMGLLQSSH
ncbi:type 1 glutamine amidotransferase domain-containing protein [Halosquirtibacter laminarini]|uniref:Type 1 glutamine amidotransferase domain-containing protein n=1 Tax=Halosquirtibacter laminarini TaxID=3374600 RepID=A0AC61NH58_9BACT|nr:type 1 glutamine amidotransferase domain-containing protein [Prolixibacteraceae bacterium]